MSEIKKGGVFIEGTLLGVEELDPFKRNTGEVVHNKRIAILGELEVYSIEIPIEQEFKKKIGEEVRLKVEPLAWNKGVKCNIRYNLK